MTKADDIFWRQFGVILGGLSLFGIVVFFIARAIAGDAHTRQTNAPSAVAARIAPMAQVRVGDPTKVVAAAPVEAPAAAAAPSGTAGADAGETVYGSACAACHATGAANAPKLEDRAAWAPRLALGMDALLGSVINGKGAMPPRAGNASLTDDQIRAAIVYIMSQAGDGAGGEAAAPAESTVAAATEMAASAGAAVQQAAAAGASAVVEAAKEAATAIEQTTEQVATAPAASDAPAGKPGAEVYNTGCVACHATGAANAPKLDDKAAWESRAGTGFDALVNSVLNGKGAMPPKGGLMSLGEGDVRNAVRYMLEQAGVDAGG